MSVFAASVMLKSRREVPVHVGDEFDVTPLQGA
jgi:hypothetical protein